MVTTTDLQSFIAATVGILISLATTYVPRFNDWYKALDPVTKGLVQLGLVFLACLIAFGGVCFQLFNLPSLTCDSAGGMILVKAFVVAMIGNQMTYLIHTGQVN